MKNKYFYPIYKLKIKSWIKYWLIRQTEFKGVLSDILEGTSFYLTDCLNMKFKIFDIIGRSVQDGDPTPENPVPIKNTGDNGSVNEKIENKNYWHSELPILFKSSNTQVIKNSNGGIDITLGSDNTLGYIYYDLGKISDYKNKTLTLSIKNEPNSLYRYCGFINCDSTGNNRIEIGDMGSSNNKKTITIGDNYTQSNLAIRLHVSNGTASTTYSINNIQLEQGSTATSYVPHSEQNISFPLAEGQKFYEGSYPDDDEKVHHVRGEVVFDGTEAWEYAFNTCVRIVKSDVMSVTSMSDLGNIKCTHLKTYSQNAVQNGVVDYGISTRIGSTPGICIRNKDYTSLAEYKSWLAEQYTNGTPVKVQYELAEEVIEPYTEEQKTAWKEWKKARTYKNVTHISSEDETPALLKIQYWKEG